MRDYSIGGTVLLGIALIFPVVVSGAEGPLVSDAASRFARWSHFTIADPLPGSDWGTAGPVVGDYDGDGRLDVVISRRQPREAYWFQRKQDGQWIRHTIGHSDGLEMALGAATLDIDADGHPDLVFNHVWFKNPGDLRNNPDAPWPPQPFGGEGHDIIATDLSNDGRIDVVVFNGKELSYFDPARNLARTVIAKGLDHHGGIAPRGVGDLNGDGFPDAVIAGAWFEHPGRDDRPWTRHAWPHLLIPKASYGTSMRCWVADLNQDGQQDIVYSDCDTGSSHVYWVENKGRGADWVRHDLPDPPTRPGDVPGTGSFHSLAVADFDEDGLLDIFAGEQEDPTTGMTKQGRLPMKPPGLKPRGVIWPNPGGPNPAFVPVVIHVGNPGWHDVAVADINSDGAPDLVSKIWYKDGPTYHADFWRNDIRPGKRAPAENPQRAGNDALRKIFMHWDMEGASGLFEQPQAWYWNKDVAPEVGAKGRELLTEDVNSAVRAALDAGVDELIVCDTHHGGGNFFTEKLLSDPRVRYLDRSVGVDHGKRRWMPGMDETVDGLMLMGHHAKPGTEDAFLPHVQTLSWADFQINGQSVGEIGIESCYAGHWNVPLVLVQGDEAACREAEQQFPGVVTAAVKKAERRDRCAGLTAEDARRLTARRIAEAIEKMRTGGFKPYRPALPMTVTLRMTTPDAAESLAKRFQVEQIRPDTLQARCDQQCDVIKWITGTGLDMAEP